MTDPELGSRLTAIAGPDAVREREPLAPHTSFNVGGPADWLVTVTSVEQWREVLVTARASGQPVTVLGGGTNVVIADDGLRGVVILPRLVRITEPQPGTVRAEAGVTINGLVRWTVGHGLAGLEAWAGTPGTVGGAIYGNAHYSGRNISDKVQRVHLMTREGTPIDLACDQLEFAYDTSRLQRTGEFLIWAEFAMAQGSPDELRAVARASLAHRKRTQPLAMPSAGCLFQNPNPARDRLPKDVPASAGALVDRAGLKGFRIGGATISPVHANFVVSDGSATAADIRAVAEAAREAVRTRFGVELRDEVVYLGSF